MDTTTIEYTAAGLNAVGYLATPTNSAPHGAVLVCHEGPGQDDHVRWRTERLASEFGYTALALDYHGDAAVLPPDEYIARLVELQSNPATLLAIANAGLDVLAAQPHVDADRLAVVGYCFGGTMALELGRSGADLRAIIALHARLTPMQATADTSIRAQLFVAVGSEDPIIPTDQHEAFRQEMQSRNADFTFEVHDGVGHSFTNKAADAWGVPGIAYDEAADLSTWDSMTSLLAATINN